MEYRQLGRTGFKVGALGLGTEYLIGAARDHIVKMIRSAYEHEINYFELFPANPLFRDAMGEAFAPFRQQVFLGAHLGAQVVETQYDKTRDIAACRRWFEDFLARYHTDYVDVLFLHNIDTQEDYNTVMAPGGVCDLAQTYRRNGAARAVGFSGHTVSTALQAVESGLIDVLLFPVNLAGNTLVSPEANSMAGIHDLLQTCATRGVAVIAMKPFAGGQLLDPAQPNLKSVTAAQCLAYTLAQPGVACVVPGCKNEQELEQALAYFTASAAQRDYAQAIVDAQQHPAGECVYCNHCLPCPVEIDIARLMRLLDKSRGQASETLRAAYNQLNATASYCVRCGACEERCPFGVAVMQRMEEMSALYGI
ncbi:MAG: aldo/keto reductase [Chloroflexi bacterium]|nr:aldo/keto reductase [Chloroflexota bacterium]